MTNFVEKQHNISYISTIWAAIASVGWYVIAIAISLWWAFPYIREKYVSWKLWKDEQDYAAKYHKNPDLLQKRLSAMEASRQKMQEEYHQKCMPVQHEGKEEKGKMKGMSGTMHGNNMLERKDDDQLQFTKKKYNSIRGEYNPLMGDSSRGYRPPKRPCCGKGGCG